MGKVSKTPHKNVDIIPLWPFRQVEFQMSDGTCFAMSDPRRFGRLRLSTAPEKEAPISTMGAVTMLKDWAEFLEDPSQWM